MRLCLLAGLCLLTTAGVSLSDYLIIKLDANKDYIATIETGEKPPPAPEEKDAAPATPLMVHAVVEIRRDLKVNKSQDVQFAHKWGNKAVIPYELMEPVKKQLLSDQYDQRKKALLRDGKTGPRFLDLAQWCLAHTLDKQFHEAMEEATLVDAVNPTVAAYHKLKALLGKPPTNEDPTTAPLLDDLKREGYRTSMSPAGYYTVLHNLPATKQGADEIKRRTELLDSTFEDFYYWFLFNGKGMMPRIPQYRLPAVFIANAKEFHSKHIVWGTPSLVADGFTPRNENIMIVSATRMDEGHGALARRTKLYLPTMRVPERELLNGDVWDPAKMYVDISSDAAAIKSVKRFAFMQTMLMVQKALEEEAELASTTHQALRQLTIASGLLPQNVIVPEWIQHGLAASFDTPTGAVYRGMFIPSWSNLPLFKHFRRTKQLGDSKDVLVKTITDAYFRQARRTESAITLLSESNLVQQARLERQVAQSSSWALTYYLIKTGKLPGIQRYRDELDRLPRDLELSETTLEGCFARAFDLTDAARFQSFADAWFAEMENVHLPIAEVEIYALKALSAK